MKFRTKQAADYWIGSVLLLLLFPPVRGLGLLLRRNHGFETRRGCAVIKMVGAGSLFLAAPAMQEIRHQFPSGKFYLIGTRAVTGFAETFGWFDEYWVIDDRSLGRLIASTIAVICKAAWRCDHVIDLEVHSRFTTLLSVLTLVRNRIGFVDEIAFWRRGFYTHMTYFAVSGPVYAFYDMLVTWFGRDHVAVSTFNTAFQAKIATAPLPLDLLLPPQYVALGPGCSDFGKESQVLPDEWAALLSQQGVDPQNIVLLGAASDTPVCEAIIAATGGGLNLCGHLGIAQSARVLAGATHFYGIDSLLLHLARALAVPSLSIWGPSDPATRLRPAQAPEGILYAKIPCSPCIHVHETPPCQGARDCMPAALASTLSPPPAAPRNNIVLGWVTGPDGRGVQTVKVHHA
jgi:ADP-heptose:LPS heptosyltransferase